MSVCVCGGGMCDCVCMCVHAWDVCLWGKYEQNVANVQTIQQKLLKASWLPDNPAKVQCLKASQLPDIRRQPGGTVLNLLPRESIGEGECTSDFQEEKL